MSEQPLQGRVAVVTGASWGLGATIGRALAGAGATVGLRARTVAQEEFGAGLHTVSLNTGTLAAGVYVLRLRQGNLYVTRRLVVVR